MFCTKCGSGWAYLPFYGPPECINPDCSAYNRKHAEIVRRDILAAKEKENKQLSLNYEDNEDNEETPTEYFVPFMNMYFSDSDD